jgi:hypothetical protein
VGGLSSHTGSSAYVLSGRPPLAPFGPVCDMSVDRHVDAIGEVQLFLKAHSKTIADTLYGLQQQKAPESSAVGVGC